MKKKTSEYGLNLTALELTGYDKEKLEKAIKGCIREMGELTIDESKIAMEALNRTLNKMYLRSPDTLIGTIPPAQ